MLQSWYQKTAQSLVNIKGVFKRSYCCYGNVLCQKNDDNVFNNDWAIFDTMIVASSDKEWL